jgi:hypothetical protein
MWNLRGIILQNINWKAQSLINSVLKDEIGKKQLLTKKNQSELE